MNSLIAAVLLICLVTNCTIFGWLLHRWSALRNHRSALENYLRAERLNAVNGRTGLHTTVHLVTKLGLTQDEIIQASAASRHIFRMFPIDHDAGQLSDVLFGYQD